MAEREMAVAAVSYDGYSDIWDTFALCINKFWPKRECKTYLITNHAAPEYDGIEIVQTGTEVSWSRRVRRALETIGEEYVLLLLEDYLISEPVESEKVSAALRYMRENDLDYLRIAPIPVVKGAKKGTYASEITSKNVYGVNLQAAIWKRSFLLDTLGAEDFSAWEFEARQKFGEATRVDGKCFATREFVIPYLNGIIQGKWYAKTLDAFAAIGMEIPRGKRSVMTEGDMKRENRRNYLLHHIPPGVIKLMKPLAKKLGFKFVT